MNRVVAAVASRMHGVFLARRAEADLAGGKAKPHEPPKESSR